MVSYSYELNGWWTRPEAIAKEAICAGLGVRAKLQVTGLMYVELNILIGVWY